MSGAGAEATPARIDYVSRGLVYGTVAIWMGKKEETEFASHKWCVYVRGPDQYDITPFIKQVTFNLHPSFNNPTRYRLAARAHPHTVCDSSRLRFSRHAAL